MLSKIPTASALGGQLWIKDQDQHCWLCPRTWWRCVLPVAIREPELLASVHFLNRGALIVPGRSVASGILRELFKTIEVCRLCQRL